MTLQSIAKLFQNYDLPFTYFRSGVAHFAKHHATRNITESRSTPSLRAALVEVRHKASGDVLFLEMNHTF